MPETPRRPSRPVPAGPRETPAPDGRTVPPADAAPNASGAGLPAQLPAPFGRYELLELLGQGGMGAVYLAHDKQLDRRVALKIPLFGPNANPAPRERFLREARAAAQIHHPNVCPVYDANVQDGTPYLTMAYVEGQILRTVIRNNRPVPQKAAAAIARQIAQGMQAAHEHGVVHRDLKPTNVIITPRKQAVIMDFGLAQVGEGPVDARLTRDGSTLGTPAYMAPEQVRGDKDAMGPGCDIYSLGVILYEMLTGRLPFSLKEGLGALMLKIALEPPRPMRKFRPDLDPGLEAICLAALAKTPAERFGSMREFAAALEPFARGTAQAAGSGDAFAALTFASLTLEVPAVPVAVPRRPPMPRPRRAILWGVAGGSGAFVCLSAVAVLIWTHQKPADHGPVVAAFHPTVSPVVPRTTAGPILRPGPFSRLTEPEPRPRPVPTEPKPPIRPAPPPKPPTPTVQPPAPPQPPPLRQPPTRTEQVRRDKEALAAFQRDITAAERDRAAQGRLFLEIRRAVSNIADQPGQDNSARRYALWRLMQRRAVRWARPRMALSAVLEIAHEFRIDVLEEKRAVLESARQRLDELKVQPGRVGLTPEQWLLAAHELAESALGLDEEATAAGAWRTAETALQLAERTGKLARNSTIVARVRARRKELPALQSERARADAAAVKLKTAPDDPAANGERGRWLLKSGASWPAALAHLVKAGGPWGEVAARDLAGPAEPAARRAVGDAWWALARAERQPRLRARLFWRASSWYDLAVDGLSGLERRELEQKIRDVRRVAEPKPTAKLWAETFTGQPASLGSVNEAALEAGYLGGRYYFQFKQVSDRFLVSPKLPVAENFACRLTGSVVQGNTAAWSLQLNAADGFGLNVQIGNGQCRVRPTFRLEKSYAQGKPLVDVPIRSFQPQGPNALLVVVRGRRVEISVNSEAICEPFMLDRDLSPCRLSLAGHPRELPTRIEFEQFAIWSADGVETPEAHAAAVK